MVKAMRILIDTNILFSNDCPILRAAIAANCDVILTGNKDLLEANLLRPAPLSASEFLKK